MTVTFPGLPFGTIGPAETAPVVDAGEDQILVNTLETELAGTVTDQFGPAGGYTTTWTKVYGPGTVTFTDASELETDVEFSVIGAYILRLTATDGVTTTSDDIIIGAGLGSASFIQFWPPDLTARLDPPAFERGVGSSFAPAQIP